MNGTYAPEPALASLLEFAQRAALHSYSPYSGFRVGAALRLTNGEIVTGTNVENASYGLTICAERSALVRAVSEFGNEIRIEAVAVANLNGAASPPCGACRQVLAEFILPHAPVVFPGASGILTMTFQEILPLAFMTFAHKHESRAAFAEEEMNYQEPDPSIIPPRSVVQALRASAQEPDWKEYEGRIFRIGYYRETDGLQRVWLVDDAGNYEKSVDQDAIRTHFKILQLSRETDLYGVNRRTIGPR